MKHTFIRTLILIICIPVIELFPWGAITSICETHQAILAHAYNLLICDQALWGRRYLPIADILSFEGVSIDVQNWTISGFGPGPDSEGATDYSAHYYNPLTNKGYAPANVAHFFRELCNPQGNKLKGAAWAAHFLADMSVPYHVVGMPRDDARYYMQSNIQIINDLATGPAYLYDSTRGGNLPPSGWGLRQNFWQATVNYVQGHSAGFADWYDPWYTNGGGIKKTQVVYSSHAQWEDKAHALYLQNPTYNGQRFSDSKSVYNPAWKNANPDFSFKTKPFAAQAQQAGYFAAKVARYTRKNINLIYQNPIMGIDHAIRNVATLWRASFSALLPSVYIVKDETQRNKYLIQCRVKNTAFDSAHNVHLKLTVFKDGRKWETIRSLGGSLFAGNEAPVVFAVDAGPDQKFSVLLEVAAKYDIPDMQYASATSAYQTKSENEVQPQENVFGRNQYSEGDFQGEIYFIPENSQRLPNFSGLSPAGVIFTRHFNVPPQAFDSGFPGVSNRFEWFAIKYTGQFFVQQEGNYAFEIISDDGARLFIDNKLVIDNDGIHGPATAGGSIYLKKGPHFLQLEYFQGPRFHIALQLFVKPPGGNKQIF